MIFLIVKKVHRRLLKTINNKVSVWLVCGRLVRSVFDIEFTEGGHDLVYNYIPKNEVWLDDDVLSKERIYIMRAGKIEWQARNDRKKLRENLALLGMNE